MEFIEWNENLSVGVKKFDDEHRSLIDFINRLNHALQVKETKKTVEEILDGLVRYTGIHFTHEEELMTLYDYPRLAAHKEEHQKLTAQVAEFNERYRSGGAPFSLELMVFLKDWLINHISGSDMAYSDFFRSKGVG
ncbi:MAG: hemerythrin family protein [Spirochaetes bacterium]|nr:hemerythrin family protein [Spirochaetota bacterium]